MQPAFHACDASCPPDFHPPSASSPGRRFSSPSAFFCLPDLQKKSLALRFEQSLFRSYVPSPDRRERGEESGTPRTEIRPQGIKDKSDDNEDECNRPPDGWDGPEAVISSIMDTAFPQKPPISS